MSRSKTTDPTRCGRSCYTETPFNYDGINCYLRGQQKRNTLPMYVVVMTKSETGGYKYEQRHVRSFIPMSTPQNQTVYAFFTPSSNKYNYLYVLSKQYSNGMYEGNHFTMGQKPETGAFDLHYTYYVYDSPVPKHVYFNTANKQQSAEAIANNVCTKFYHGVSTDEKQYSCNFFKNVMKHLHDNENTCAVGLQRYNVSANPQTGGNDDRNDVEPQVIDPTELSSRSEIVDIAVNLMQQLQGLFDSSLQLKEVQTYILGNKLGLLTLIDNDGLCVSLPFNYNNNEFIQIDDFVSAMGNSSGNTNAKVKGNRLPITDVCLDAQEDISMLFKRITNEVNKETSPKSLSCARNAISFAGIHSNPYLSSSRVMVAGKHAKAKQPRKKSNVKSNKK
jgi:hypothetical protein